VCELCGAERRTGDFRMILIAAAWLLVLAIALYQSMYGMFSAIILAVLTTICAVFALGTYEWLGPMFLYASQPAYADALSLAIHFIIPLIVLRTLFDKLITKNAPLGGRADRIAGGVIGFYTGAVMVGVLTIMLQMLPLGATILGFTPYNSSLERESSIYCDQFVVGLFKAAGGLASDRPFVKNHDNLLLELFCARNTAGLNGRIDADTEALGIAAVSKPTDAEWKKVIGHRNLPEYAGPDDEKTDVLVVKTTVSNTASNGGEEDGWYRLPGTHFRLVTGAGRSLYPIGYLEPIGFKWSLVPAKVVEDKIDMTGLVVLRESRKEQYQEVLWVYRMPRMETDVVSFEESEETDPEKLEELKAQREELYAPSHVVFRRNSRKEIPLTLPPVLPPTPDEIERVRKKKAAADALKAAEARKAKTAKAART